MIYQKAKLFWKVQNQQKKVFCIPFDDKSDYYTFLKEYHTNGYKQIILTSEFISYLMEYFAIEKKILVYKIEFMEEDTDLSEEINRLLYLVSVEKIYFSKLMEHIRFLSEKSSIDIKRAYFKGRNIKKDAVNFYLQANGIIGVDRGNYEEISNIIKNQAMEKLL